jgi:hypothetical protein
MSSVTARIERSGAYRRSLRQVLTLVDQFQQSLDAEQRERWLALEEELLEHVSRLNQAYFRAGVELGRRRGRGPPRAPSSGESGALPARHGGAAKRRERLAEADLIGALARLILQLAER